MTQEYFKMPRYAVGAEFVSSNGDFYALADIQHVRLRRPWLVVTGAACSGVMALAAVFWPELYPHEKAVLLTVCSVVLLVSARIGRLKLSSLVLRDGDGIIWGKYNELLALKKSIEATLRKRSGPRGNPTEARPDNASPQEISHA